MIYYWVVQMTGKQEGDQVKRFESLFAAQDRIRILNDKYKGEFTYDIREENTDPLPTSASTLVGALRAEIGTVEGVLYVTSAFGIGSLQASFLVVVTDRAAANRIPSAFKGLPVEVVVRI